MAGGPRIYHRRVALTSDDRPHWEPTGEWVRAQSKVWVRERRSMEQYTLVTFGPVGSLVFKVEGEAEPWSDRCDREHKRMMRLLADHQQHRIGKWTMYFEGGGAAPHFIHWVHDDTPGSSIAATPFWDGSGIGCQEITEDGDGDALDMLAFDPTGDDVEDVRAYFDRMEWWLRRWEELQRAREAVRNALQSAEGILEQSVAALLAHYGGFR